MTTKFRLNKRAAIALAVMSFPALIGCGAHNNNNAPPVDNGVYPLPPQNILPPMPISSCAPINGRIGFTGNGIYVSYANIRGGQLPGGGQQSGQILLGGPGGQGAYTVQTYEGTNVSMSVDPIQSPMPPVGGPYQVTYPQNTPANIVVPGQASVNGSITLSQLTQNDIMSRMGGYQNQPYPQQYPQPYGQPYGQPYNNQPYNQPYSGQSNLCITGMGMDIGHYGTRLYGGKFYLYFNNGQVYELPI